LVNLHIHPSVHAPAVQIALRRDRGFSTIAATKGETVMSTVSAWEDDPQSDVAVEPISRPVPALGQPRLGVTVVGNPPPARRHRRGTAAFRYWNAAESLTRAAQYWARVVPDHTRWYTGDVLPAQVDAGTDLNAYYDRRSLCFFHAPIGDVTVFSGESPDVVCHELGHAVLDALVPDLWNVATIETAALHESFGDISAMHSALELDSVRSAVLKETGGRLSRSSRLTRLAEQLGWAIRQSHPDAVDHDCLRNAANSFFYSPPELLPPIAPATALSSEPHSFSRVFTAAWLDLFAGMVDVVGHSSSDLLRASRHAGALFVHAVDRAAIASNYFAQVAAAVIGADGDVFAGRYREAIRRAFVGRGILSSASATSASTPARRRSGAAAVRPPREIGTRVRIPIEGGMHGLNIRHVVVEAPAITASRVFTSAAPDLGPLPAIAPERASRAFVEDLLRRNRIDPGDMGMGGESRVRPARATHALERDGRDVRLVRRLFHEADAWLEPAGPGAGSGPHPTRISAPSGEQAPRIGVHRRAGWCTTW
jgi:hypothetical protein